MCLLVTQEPTLKVYLAWYLKDSENEYKEVVEPYNEALKVAVYKETIFSLKSRVIQKRKAETEALFARL